MLEGCLFYAHLARGFGIILETEGFLLPPSKLETIAQASASDALNELDITDGEVLSRTNTVASAWAQDHAAELIGKKRLPSGELIESDTRFDIATTTRDSLRSIITEAFSDGSTIEQLAAKIRDAGAFSQARAEMIAATEAARASTQGNLAGWRESGQVATLNYILSADHSGPDECDDAAAGSPYDIDDPDLPGLPSHPNCSCSLTIGSLTGDEDEEEEEA